MEHQDDFSRPSTPTEDSYVAQLSTSLLAESNNVTEAPTSSTPQLNSSAAGIHPSTKTRFNLNIPNRISDVEILHLIDEEFTKKSQGFSNILTEAIQQLALQEKTRMLKIRLQIDLNKSLINTIKVQCYRCERMLQQFIERIPEDPSVLKEQERLNKEIDLSLFQINACLNQLKAESISSNDFIKSL